MKLKIVIRCLFVSCMFFQQALAEDNNDHATSDKQEIEKQVVRKRRKKVIMCQECGRPETECECEGHNDHDDESHEEQE